MSTLAGDAIRRHVEHLERDAESDAILDALAQAAGAPLDRARRVALGTPDGLRPFQLLWDASVAEAWSLPWTALLSGAPVPAREIGETEEAYIVRARDAVIHVRGWRRGTPESVIATARAHLIGGRRVNLVERVGGDVWRALVITYVAETPDPDQVLVDLNDPEAAVAGVLLEYRTDLGWSIDQAEMTRPDLDTLETLIPDLDVLETRLPAIS